MEEVPKNINLKTVAKRSGIYELRKKRKKAQISPALDHLKLSNQLILILFQKSTIQKITKGTLRNLEMFIYKIVQHSNYQ